MMEGCTGISMALGGVLRICIWEYQSYVLLHGKDITSNHKALKVSDYPPHCATDDGGMPTLQTRQHLHDCYAGFLLPATHK